MAKVIVLTQENNNKFVAVLNPQTDLKQWCINWIENDDQGIEFWEGGSIGIEGNEVVIWGDNGSIFLTVTEFEV